MAEYPDSAPSVEPEPKQDLKEKKPSGRLRKYWREVEAYNKAANDWHEQSEKIVKLYLDQHRTNASPRRFALLWSNIETLKPAVYAKTPNILCSRRHKDPDPIGRVAAEILERATNTTMDLYKADERFRMVRDDRLLTSRGQAWVRYEADTTGDKINYEKVCIDYVHWRDFGHNVCGTWADVWLVWRRVYKARADVRKRFGSKVADKLSYTGKTAADDDKEMGEHKACLYELWDKKEDKVCFISKDYPDIIEDGEPPTDFHDFFPCPEPCYGSKTSKSLFPTPDYRYYQDQAQEIDDLTEKIASLSDYLMVRAFVPSGPSGDGADAVRIMIQNLQSGITSNKSIFVPVESWAGFAEKGGAKGLMDWMPTDMVIATIKGAIEARTQLVQDVYQITGIADILRGQTDPNETLGAQQLKAQTGARRVRNAKDEIARFCRDIGQLVAEVIAEQFQPQTLADMSGFAYVPALPQLPPALTRLLPPPQGMPQQPMLPGLPAQGLPAAMPQGGPTMQPVAAAAPQSPSGKTFDDTVIELLRNDRMRGFLIDIETDSTIQPDEDMEKQRRTEFLTAMGGFLQQSGEMMAQAPQLFPLVSEMALFGVRGYRVGRQMEDTIETTLKNVAQQLQQRAQQPDPKVAAEQQKVQAQGQLEQQKLNSTTQLEAFKAQSAADIKKMEMAQEQEKLQMQLRFQDAELAMAQQKAASEIQIAEMKAQHEAAMREKEAQNKMALAELAANQKAQHEERKAEQDAQRAERDAAAAARDAERDNQQAAEKMELERHGQAEKLRQERERHEHGLKLAADAAALKAAREAMADAKERSEKAAEASRLREENNKKKRIVSVRKRGPDKKALEYEISFE